MSRTQNQVPTGVLGGLRLGPVASHEGLTIVPLMAERPAAGPDYELASAAMEAGTLRVSEIDGAGRVNELVVTNSGARPALLLDGEELVGAKQNRVVNHDLRRRAPHRQPCSSRSRHSLDGCQVT